MQIYELLGYYTTIAVQKRKAPTNNSLISDGLCVSTFFCYLSSINQYVNPSDNMALGVFSGSTHIIRQLLYYQTTAV